MKCTLLNFSRKKNPGLQIWITFGFVIMQQNLQSNSKIAGDLFCQARKLFSGRNLENDISSFSGLFNVNTTSHLLPLQFKKYKVLQEEGFSNFIMENTDGQCIFELFECETNLEITHSVRGSPIWQNSLLRYPLKTGLYIKQLFHQ